jgi:hypothetical protein
MDSADLDGDKNSAEPTPVDLDAHTRILCSVVDMGPYESGIGDYNCDRTTSLRDFASWPECMTGPGDPAPPWYAPGCEAFDVRHDGHVDLGDWAMLQNMFAYGQ